MKNLLLIAMLFSGSVGFAQKQNNYTNQLLLKTGQKITVTTTNTSDADLGMGMQMKNNSVNTNIITVNGENEKQYLLSNTLTKLKLSIEAMGQSQEFDSEKEGDKNTEMGKALSEAIGKSVQVSVNKFTGSPTFETKNPGPERPETNPMEGIMSSFGSEDPSVAGAFLLIPAGKKTGDSWIEKDSTKEKNSVKTYTIHSILNNIVNTSFVSEIISNNTIEMNGTQMEMAMNTRSTGNIISDLKTGLVSERTITSDVTGTMDIQGQSMPVTAKTNLVSRYLLIN